MIFKSILVYPRYPEKLKHLYELAYNLWSVWDYEAIALFYRIDARLFSKSNHNPIKLLYSLNREKLEDLSDDKGFLFELEKVWGKFQHYLQYAGTFKDECEGECNLDESDIIAYFSMEFGLHESIHIYAGGLGILSGDYLKGASDLALPVVAVGLLYKFGYFTQHIDMNGYQREIFTKSENQLIPIRELYDSQGNWAHVAVKILDSEVKVKLWKIDIGKSRLILLDTDIEDNPPKLRDITNELYAGDREKRIQQELVLGIGGIRALELLGIEAKVYHLNEGHSAFAVIGRLQNLMGIEKFSFSEAKAIIRASTVFTTHTPVIAGNENFSSDLMKKYLQPCLKATALTFDKIAPLGYVDDNTDIFWLPAFAMQFSRYINGVSKQHVRLSKKMWSDIFYERPTVEIPVISITNGVHISWISPPFTDLFNSYLGPDYIHCRRKEDLWKNIYNIPDELLWVEHRRNKKDLFNFIRRQFTEQTATGDYLQTRMLKRKRLFNIDYLTVVFARRFAGYKRPTLILKDKERLRKILTNSAKPVQLIFAGKAHPADEQSKGMIKEIIDFANQYKVKDKVIFLENYDINIARHLYWGADVWLNNPAQNMEASGTSGMKAAMNGVLHLSTLEGWWREGYNGKNGWTITSGKLYEDWQLQETADANQLYDLLEYEITDLYYNRNEADIPEDWVAMMKESIFSVCQNFNINRMICDYLANSYTPAIKSSARIASNRYKLLKEATEQEQSLLNCWNDIEPFPLSSNIEKKVHLTEDEHMEIECGFRFGKANAELFKVELFYIYNEEKDFEILPMELSRVQDNITYYRHLLKIKSYGTQGINIRITPTNEIVKDIHPELIKWTD